MPNLWVEKDFLSRTQKGINSKGKTQITDQINSIKIKKFCLSKDTIKKSRKIHLHIYLGKGSYLGYTTTPTNK